MTEYVYPIIADEQNLPFYVIGYGHFSYPNSNVNSKGNPYYQIVFCNSSEGKMVIDGDAHSLVKNSCLLIIPDTPYNFISSESSVDISIIDFAGNHEKDTLAALGLLKISKSSYLCNQKCIAIISKIKENITHNPYFNGTNNSELLYSFLISLSVNNHNGHNKNKEIKNSQLTPILKYIDENYKKDITLEELCDLVSLSPQYICKLFKECLNSRPFEYLTNVRIHYAKHYIITTRLSINQIAENVGYKDCSYFCAVFKRHEEISPIDYRNKYFVEYN